MLINQIMNILCSTFVPIPIPLLCKFTQDFVYHKLLLSLWLHATITFCKFLKVQWLHFTGVVDKVVDCLCQFFSQFCMPKIIKIGLFLTELLKSKNVVAFLKHRVEV